MTKEVELAKRKYHLESIRDGYQRDLELAKQQLPQAKFQKREADNALTEYEMSKFRVWRDKRSGTYEEKIEALTREAAAADRTYRAATELLERVQAKLAEAQAQLDCLEGECTPVDLDVLDPEARRELQNAKAMVYVNRILPLLQTAQESLEEAQQWARPNNRIDVAPGYTEGQLLARAESCARECAACLNQIVHCDVPVDIHPYFGNPSGYINGSASRFGKLDRINEALKAISQTEKRILTLQRQLAP